MPVCDSSSEMNKEDEVVVAAAAATSPTIQNRRNSLAISALLNEVSINPLQHPLAPNNTQNNEDIEKYRFLPLPSPLQQQQQQTDYFNISLSPASSSGTSSPNGSSTDSRQSSIHHEPTDLWNHSRTGLHQTNNGNIVVSSLAKAKRKRILPHQYQRLMETFESTDTPSSEIREQLAKELDMTKREVQVWFQNRRAKMSRHRQQQRSSSSSSSSNNDNSGRHHSLTSIHKSSYIQDIGLHRRRASEYSQSYVKSIAPKRSSSFNHFFQPYSNPTTTININHATNNNNTNTNNNNNMTTTTTATTTMIVEAPYHTTTTLHNHTAINARQESAIDILASAAEMMRP
ncbi:homeobox domain-containing protein [Cokeromyces recurvatus]|uniref:homeobox domain-containing protein n=1 Tax=Cokeromyces recurvatus TaxID=90255 RepID=UPI002220422C|nr:homeobox domain-containing protein [Cokeromyces recurvatus]KAI7906147.1 homeobox domain-containing protein [Cokeromyces recurvatus]